MEWLLVLIAGALGILAVLFKGRSEGREQAEGQQAKEVLERVEQAKKVSDDVRERDSDDNRERLREQSRK